jgi:hypothetical protein
MQSSELYLELADYYDQRGEAQSRDRFLVLAADAARTDGDANEAEQLRQRLLALNPHHLLKPFKSFDEALKSRDVTDYINALRRRHPADQVASLVQSMVHATPKTAAAPERDVHLHVPEPQSSKPEPAPRPVEVYRMRPPDEPAPTAIKARPVPSPPPLPNPPASTGRPRLTADSRSLPPLPLPVEPFRERSPAPFRLHPVSVPQPAVPVYQGARMAPTPGARLCSVLFLLVLVAGAGLLVYSLGRVFLPAELVNTSFIPTRE